MDFVKSEDTMRNIVRRRATCRNYRADSISQDVMDRLIEAACTSPSTGGFQRISVVIIKDEKRKKQLVKLSRGQKFIERAPVSLVFCIDHRRMRRIAEHEQSPTEPGIDITSLWLGIVDAVIAAQSVVLVAETLGLRSCYNGNVLNWPKEMSELLHLPGGVIPAIMLTVGYPVSSGSRVSRKYSLRLMVHEEVYRDPTTEELCEEHEKKFPEAYKLTPKRKERLLQTLSRQKGEEYALSSVRRVEEEGFLTAYQYWFGCYYSEEGENVTSQKEYLEYLAGHGFNL